jgi:hypothetical protein
MRQRLLATLFVVGFFAALPAWFLSTREGWVALDCARAGESAELDCTVQERFAFSSRRATYRTHGADVRRRTQRNRRGTSWTTYQLVLVTPAGEREVLRTSTGSTALPQAATALDAALRARAATFHAEVPPDDLFWLGLVLLVVFAGVGLLIVWHGEGAPRRDRTR